jgi:hypothetical protein
MGVVLRNNVFSVLAAPLASTDTTMIVDAADGNLFPILGPGQYTYATLSSPGAPSVSGGATVIVEIVKITARSGNSMTIERGADGTIPSSFPENAVVALRINAASVMESFLSNYDVLLI